MSINLTDISSGYNLSKFNDNFKKIEDEFNNNTLRRGNLETGEANAMRNDLDMNGFLLLNANTPEGPLSDVVEKAKFQADRAEAEADRAEGEADRSGTEADRAKAEADRSKSEADRSALQVDLAKDQVVLAADQVTLAKNEVHNAELEVDKAKQEVVKAAAQVDLAKDEVNNAKAEVVNAQAEVVRAATEADRSKSEADRAGVIADQLEDGIRNAKEFDPSLGAYPAPASKKNPFVWFANNAGQVGSTVWTKGEQLHYVPDATDPENTLGAYYRVGGELTAGGTPQPVEFLDDIVLLQGKKLKARTGQTTTQDLVHLNSSKDVLVGDATSTGKVALVSATGKPVHAKTVVNGVPTEVYNILTDEDGDVVRTSGNETIGGTKTFSTPPKSSQPASADDDLVRKVDLAAETAGKADKAYVDSELVKKADKTYVDTELTTKAPIAYVDSQISAAVGPKADTTYVDSENAKDAKLDGVNVFTKTNSFTDTLQVPTSNIGSGNPRSIRYNDTTDSYEGYTQAEGWSPMGGGGAGFPEPLVFLDDFTAVLESGNFCSLREGVPMTVTLPTMVKGDWLTIGDAYGMCSATTPIIIKNALNVNGSPSDLILREKNINLALQVIDNKGGVKIVDGIGENSLVGSPERIWKDVTGERELGNEYINTTGSEIELFVKDTYNNKGGHIEVTINGMAFTSNEAQTTISSANTITLSIPANATYKVVGNKGLDTWRELRA